MSEKPSIVSDGNKLSVVGSLTVSHVNSLYRTALDFRIPSQEICLKRVDDIDSAGLALLVYWSQSGEKVGSTVNYVHPSEKIKALAAICELDNVFAERL